MAKTVIVIPCYNEEKRIHPEGFFDLASIVSTRLIFVDDGSSDDTFQVLKKLVQILPQGSSEILKMNRNVGKAEAVRQGVIKALSAADTEIVGYVDSDLATPSTEVRRILSIFSISKAKAIWGSRVLMLGVDIDRHATRHYSGRVFATFASIILNLPVYDTQCGAKFFRRTGALESAFSTTFASRWGFDVEMIGRLIWPSVGVSGLSQDDFLEVPLKVWKDVSGTHFNFMARVQAALELFRIHLRLRKRRIAIQAQLGAIVRQ